MNGYTYAFKVNKEGFIIDSLVVNESQKKVDEITAEIPSEVVYKPKWNGTKWIEGATQEEIDELTKPQPMPPSNSDRIQALEEALLNMMMEGMM